MRAEDASVLRLEIPGEEAMIRFGEALARALRPGDLLGLSGPLGAGKSTLARAVLRSLSGDSSLEAPSPAFSLCREYEFDSLRVWHCDLYRLESPAELDELGLEEALESGAAIVEWPERAGHRLPVAEAGARIEIAIPDDSASSASRDEPRLVRIEAPGPRGGDLADRIADSLGRGGEG